MGTRSKLWSEGGRRVAEWLGVALLAFCCCAAVAQVESKPADAPAKLPKFEVASIRLADYSDGQMHRMNGFDTYPGGRIACSGCTLQYLIMLAFNLQDYQVVGVPSWAREIHYNIQAIPPEDSLSARLTSANRNPPTEEQRQMLQSLLIDRFQLKFHRDSKEGPIYILQKGKNALKLQTPKDKEAYPLVGGIGGGGISSGAGIAGRNITMSQMATDLSMYFKCTVLDQTGIQGSFDFEYRTGNDDPDANVLSSIITSLNGIGLHLKSAKGLNETIVIDHVEPPSAN